MADMMDLPHRQRPAHQIPSKTMSTSNASAPANSPQLMKDPTNTPLHLSLPSWLDAPPINTSNFHLLEHDKMKRRIFTAHGIRTLIPCDHYRSLPPADTTENQTRTDEEKEEIVRGYKVKVWKCIDTLHTIHTLLHPLPNPCLTPRASVPCKKTAVPEAVNYRWDTHTQKIMAEALYGSNYIERVGASPDITRELCFRVWSGEIIVPEKIDTSSAEYRHHLYDIEPCGPVKNESAGWEDVVLSRKEIVGHAKAMQHILTHFTSSPDALLTQEIILSTHRLLVEGIDIPPPTNKWAPQYHGSARGVPWTEYGGIYRTGGVRAGSHVFPHSDLVPELMEGMCARYRREIEEAQKKGSLDPVVLASKMSLDFVQIHPFVDGNGRMSRLILNAVLFKYLGIMAPICGDMSSVSSFSPYAFNFVEDEMAREVEEKKEEARRKEYDTYMGIVIRAGQRRKVLEDVEKDRGGSQDRIKKGDWFWEVQPDDAGEFAGLVAEKCWESMSRMRSVMEGNGLLPSQHSKNFGR